MMIFEIETLKCSLQSYVFSSLSSYDYEASSMDSYILLLLSGAWRSERGLSAT